MTVTAECEVCGHKFEIELKPRETIQCPNCKSIFDVWILMNDPQNREFVEWLNSQPKEIKEKMSENERNEIEELCARLRYICKAYKDVDLTKCTIVGGDLPFTHISNVSYLPCSTISGYHLANCNNYKACRDFEDGFKEIKEND